VLHLHSCFPSIYKFLLVLVDRKTAKKLQASLNSSSVLETLKLKRNRVKCKLVFEVTDVTVNGISADPHSSQICCMNLGIWLQRGFHSMGDGTVRQTK
jgi:hypothetical protein